MVCYARPAIRMAALVLIAFLIFERPVGHFFDAAALVVAITVAVVVAAALAAIASTVFLSTRRRRARAGGCVSCTLRCQHAMTEGPRRLRLVSITDRTPAAPTAAPGIRAVVPAGRSLPVVSINGRPSPSSSPGHTGPAGWPSRGHAAPAGRSSGSPSSSSSLGHQAPVGRPARSRPGLARQPSARPGPVAWPSGRPEPVAPPSADRPVPVPAEPGEPRWPDRPARRVPERVGS